MLQEEPAYDEALFGKDPAARIVAVEPLRGTSDDEQALMTVYRRSDDGRSVLKEEAPVYPFFFLSDRAFLQTFSAQRFRIRKLEGENHFRHLVYFQTWSAYWDAIRHVERALGPGIRRADVLYLSGTPAQQYLVQSGRTLFKGMAFEDLHRMQIDIETYSEEGFPNAAREQDGIIIIAMRDNRGWSGLSTT